MRKYVEDDNGCWVWLGACSDSGTPLMSKDGRMVSARRAMLEEGKDYVLDRRVKVTRSPGCHPKCVNPSHSRIRRNHEINEAFMEAHGAHRRRRSRRMTTKRLEELEKARKKWSI